MKQFRTLFPLVLFGAMMLAQGSPEAGAQDLHPSRRLSPLGMARTFVGEAYVKVTFSRPYQRGRDNIFGAGDDAMHPYGKIWRFGANEPTELTVSAPVSIGGSRLEPGTYSLFVTPGENEWKLHVNDLRGGGAGDYDAARDLAVVSAAPSSPAESVDPFTIRFEKADEAVHMVAEWMDIQLRFPLTPAE